MPTSNNTQITTTPIHNKEIQGRKHMWPLPETVAWIYKASNIALIIGLIVTAGATVLVVWMGNVK